jgi:FtsP/CotA-like multicopper oxidase with cupredoxin domain
MRLAGEDQRSRNDEVSRRTALLAGAGLPLGMLAGPALAKATQDVEPTIGDLATGARQFKPDYILNIEPKITSPLGVPVGSILVNNQDPGPEIRYTEGDTFRVLLQNHLDTPCTVHWHGMIVPNWMDGVPDITQMPIHSGQSFFVEYPLVQTGSYWYHSHFGLQEQLGLHGPLIIEEKTPPYTYDHDVTCFGTDWVNQDPYTLIPQIRGDQPATEAVRAPTGDLYKLPGSNKKFNVDINYPGFMLNGGTNDTPWTFNCRKGDRLRLRLINGATATSFRVALDGHDMKLIQCDGNPCVPITVDSICLAVAERYDVLVTIKKTGTFTLHWCAIGQAQQVVGIINADGNGKPNLSRPTFGPRTGGMGHYGSLRSPHDTRPPAGPVRTFDMELGGDMMKYLWSMSGEYLPEAFVPKFVADAAPLNIEYGERVRIRFTNTTTMWHPMHLHGHFYRLLTKPGKWDQRDAILKDTVGVGPGEHVDIEFYADNPGHWIFHCHNLYHLAAGMGRIFHYGVSPVGLEIDA